MKKIEKVIICGLGGMGCICATQMSKCKEIEFKVLVDEERYKRYKKEPTFFNNEPYFFDYTLPSDTNFQADLIIIATKYDGLKAAINNIKNFVKGKSMTFLVAIILGLVQGITEFLPISSSGHLVILEHWFGVEVDAVLLNVLLHIATLFAVLWYFRKTIAYLILNPFCKMNKYLVVATIPAVVFVLLFGKLFDSALSSLVMVGIGFILTGIFLALSQIISKQIAVPKPLNWGSVLTMGFAQALAIFPGLSRSGTTYAFGVVAGTEKNTALDFSFLMSIPIIVASLVYELAFSGEALTLASTHWLAVVISMVTAFLSALLGLKFMKVLVNKIGFWWFVPYLIIVGILLLVL